MGSRNYLFTIFPSDPADLWNDDWTADRIFEEKENVKYAIWQLEVCPDTERKHVQGYMELPKVTRPGAAKKLFVEAFARTVHIEKRRGTREQAVKYCSKEESRAPGTETKSYGVPSVQGKRSDIEDVLAAVKDNKTWDEIADEFPEQAAKYQGFIKERIEKHRASLLQPPDITLRAWQQDLERVLLGPPHPRSIMWYWDERGNTGKTTFTTWLLRSYPRMVQVFLGGRSADVAFALDSEKSIFIFDYTREATDFISYSTLEQIKNGMVWSPKYASIVKQFATPHVLVFSNQEPDRTKMSSDRWDVHHIGTYP